MSSHLQLITVTQDERSTDFSVQYDFFSDYEMAWGARNISDHSSGIPDTSLPPTPVLHADDFPVYSTHELDDLVLYGSSSSTTASVSAPASVRSTNPSSEDNDHADDFASTQALLDVSDVASTQTLRNFGSSSTTLVDEEPASRPANGEIDVNDTGFLGSLHLRARDSFEMARARGVMETKPRKHGKRAKVRKFVKRVVKFLTPKPVDERDWMSASPI